MIYFVLFKMFFRYCINMQRFDSFLYTPIDILKIYLYVVDTIEYLIFKQYNNIYKYRYDNTIGTLNVDKTYFASNTEI